MNNVLPMHDNAARAEIQAQRREALAIAVKALWGTHGLASAYVDVIGVPCSSCGAPALAGCVNQYSQLVKKIPCARRGHDTEAQR